MTLRAYATEFGPPEETPGGFFMSGILAGPEA